MCLVAFLCNLVFRFQFLSCLLEWISIECRKTKSEAVALTNHNRYKQHNEPIRSSKEEHMSLASSAGVKHVTLFMIGFGFFFYLVERMALFF